MQAYDLIMLIVLAMATIFGAIKGFAWQVASFASIIVSYVVAYRFRFDVAEMIQAKPPWNLFLAMLILYVGTSFVIWVAFRLFSGMIDRVRLKEFDRHLGAAFGLAKGLVYCLLITMFAMSLLGPNQQAAICQSRSGYYIATALDRGVGVLPKEIHDVVGPYLANLDNKLKNGQTGQPYDPSQGTGLGGLMEGLGGLGGSLGDGLGGQLGEQLNNLQSGVMPPAMSDALGDLQNGLGNVQSGLQNGAQIPGGQVPQFPSNGWPSNSGGSIFPPGTDSGLGGQQLPQFPAGTFPPPLNSSLPPLGGGSPGGMQSGTLRPANQQAQQPSFGVPR